MMRTEAPKDLEGRGFVNFARTTPELPSQLVSQGFQTFGIAIQRFWSHTVGTGDPAPDHTDLRSANLLLCPVNVRDLLAKVEAVFFSRQHGPPESNKQDKTHLAALVSSTPSILIKLVLGWVVRRPR